MKTPVLLTLASFALMAVAGACEETIDPGNGTPVDSFAIGPDGGTLTFLNGAVVLVFPPGAVAESTTFTVSLTTAHPGGPTVIPSAVVDVGPSGTTFAQPVELSLRYLPSVLPAGVREHELGLHKVVSDAWVFDTTSVPDTAANVLRAAISSLSVFGVRGHPVATVTVEPASVTLVAGGTQQFTAIKEDINGNVLADRPTTWMSSDNAVATVDNAGLARGETDGGPVMITATSEGQSGTANVTVSTVSSGEPVYNPNNPNHVLHVFEDWSTYTTPADIASTNRVDGGGPWEDQTPGFKSFSTTNNDPWVGVRTLTFDYQASPGQGQSLGHGLDLTQSGQPPQYLNANQAGESIVLEWAWRFSGNAAYEGKILDFQPTPGTDRFNYQAPANDQMGSQLANSCDSDPLCSLYYTNNGSSPRFVGLLPTSTTFGAAFARSRNLDTDFYVQNRNFGNGSGQVNWGGPNGANMVDDTWRRTIIRLTRNAGGQSGFGRIEEWLQRAGESAVKVMEYIGDAGGYDQGLVFSRGSSWIVAGTTLHFYNLTSVFDIFAGGSTVHIGYFRIWSHPRDQP